MKGVLHWLIRWACRASTIDFRPALAAPVSSLQNFIFLTAYFYFISPDHPATWAGSRAGSPISGCPTKLRPFLSW